MKLKALPVAEVPTTCGTGSEATPYAILTRNDIKTKQSISHKIYPALACIDARYLKKTPADIIINTAIDALGHLLESYFNTKAQYLPSILIGYISEINQDSNNITKSGKITPAVDFEHLEEVLVILKTKQQIEDK